MMHIKKGTASGSIHWFLYYNGIVLTYSPFYSIIRSFYRSCRDHPAQLENIYSEVLEVGPLYYYE